MPKSISRALLVMMTALTSFGSTIYFAQDPHNTIIGDPAFFEVFGAQLTQPTASNPLWVLTIEMNYGAGLPGSPDFFPTFPIGGVPYVVGDFLIEQTVGNTTTDYGIVLSNHLNAMDDFGQNYAPGSLYVVPSTQSSSTGYGFVTSGQLIFPSLRPMFPIWLAPNGNKIGDGSLSVAITGDGITSAKYTVTDMFSAPVNFLGTDPFSVDFSTAICANGILTGPPVVPEPGTLALVAPALLFLGFGAFRRYRAAVKSADPKSV